MNIELIRKNYSITTHDIYLNHAATTPIAISSAERMKQLCEQMQRPLGEHFYAWLGILEDTRRRTAELINAHPAEIAFCQNTSTGLSLIANAIAFNPGDCIIVPRNEFPSNIYIWQSLQAKGVRFQFFDVEPGIPVAETLAKIDLSQVRLLSISAVSYYTGRQYDLASLSQFCKERNILFCIDAIQAIGATPFDIQKIQPDFVACGAQKWLLGSIGAGFIYAKKELLEKLHVSLVGWTSVKYAEDFSIKTLDFSNEMTRFEPGLPDILPIAALNQSLRELHDIGWQSIYEKINWNTTYLTRGLLSQGISSFAADDDKAGIVSFQIPTKIASDALLAKIATEKIHLTHRDNYIRVSPHFYNTQHELDTFLNLFDVVKQPIFEKKQKPTTPEQHKSILIIGGTGAIGSAFARKLVKDKFQLTLVGRDSEKLTSLKNELSVNTLQVDLDNPHQFQSFMDSLKKSDHKYDALIYCAGIAETDEFIHLPIAKFKSMLQVNCIAAFELMQLFLTHLATANPLGILTIASPSGRCGFPLFSGYAASNAALWSLGEVLAREIQNDVAITTYIAPPLHSRMQKRIGRIALRYFKMSGVFPYKQAHELADDAWNAFINKKNVVVSTYNRLSLWINAVFPNVINKRIKKIWKR